MSELLLISDGRIPLEPPKEKIPAPRKKRKCLTKGTQEETMAGKKAARAGKTDLAITRRLKDLGFRTNTGLEVASTTTQSFQTPEIGYSLQKDIEKNLGDLAPCILWREGIQVNSAPNITTTDTTQRIVTS